MCRNAHSWHTKLSNSFDHLVSANSLGDENTESLYMCVCSICDIHLKRKWQQAVLVNTSQKNTCSTEGTMRLRALPVPLGADGGRGACVYLCVCGAEWSDCNWSEPPHRDRQTHKMFVGASASSGLPNHTSPLLFSPSLYSSLFHKSTHSLLLSYFLLLFFQKQSIFFGSLATDKQSAARGAEWEGWREA